jgi:hypothetical protein
VVGAPLMSAPPRAAAGRRWLASAVVLRRQRAGLRGRRQRQPLCAVAARCCCRAQSGSRRARSGPARGWSSPVARRPGRWPRGRGGGGVWAASLSSARRSRGGRWFRCGGPPWVAGLAPAGPWWRCATTQGQRRGGAASGGRGAGFGVSQTAVGWREVLAYRAWRPERRLRDSRWCCWHAPGRLGGRACFLRRGRRPSCRWLALVCSFEELVVGLHTKVLPDLVGAGNGGARGRRSSSLEALLWSLDTPHPPFRGENSNPACRIG